MMILLEDILNKFYSKYNIKDYYEVSIFSDFNKIIDNLINNL